MSSWTDLLQSLAEKRSVRRPPVINDNLWDHQERISALEDEVNNLKTILVAVLDKLHSDERDGF